MSGLQHMVETPKKKNYSEEAFALRQWLPSACPFTHTDRQQAYIDFSMRPAFGDGEPLHKHWVTSLRFIPAFALSATCGRGIPFQQARGSSDLISYTVNTERRNRAAAFSLVHWNSMGLIHKYTALC